MLKILPYFMRVFRRDQGNIFIVEFLVQNSPMNGRDTVSSIPISSASYLFHLSIGSLIRKIRSKLFMVRTYASFAEQF